MTSPSCFPSCVTRDMFDLLAEKWVLLVLDHLRSGPVRFLQLQRQVGSVSEKSLTQTLRRLESRGVIIRTHFQVVPPRVDYALSELGHSLIEQVSAFRKWAEAHADRLGARGAQHPVISEPAPLASSRHNELPARSIDGAQRASNDPLR